MSENTLPNPGSYLAKRSGPIVIGETANKAVMAYIPYRLLGDTSFEDFHAVCLMSKDGVLQTRNFEELHKVFPAWEDNDPFKLQDIEIPEGDEPEFHLKECFHEEYTPEGKEPRMQFRVKWFNALNSDPRIPAPMDESGRKDLLNRIGNKLKALGGIKRPAAKAPAPAVPAKPVAAPKKAVARVSDEMSVYTGIQAKFPDKSEEEQNALFFKTQWDLFPSKPKDKDNQWVTPLTPEEWGQVADKLEL